MVGKENAVGEAGRIGIVINETLEKGFQTFKKELERMLEVDPVGPNFVFLSGRSSSGKTSAVTERVVSDFGRRVGVLSLDNYSKGNSFVSLMKNKGVEINWDHPLYMDFELVNEHLKALKAGRPIRVPVFSFITGERDGYTDFVPRPVVIVEGTFALHEKVDKHEGLRVFVDISLHGSMVRRLMRDVSRTTMDPASILRYYLGQAEPMYQEHISPTKACADIVLVNEYDPVYEAGRAPSQEVQVKFQEKLSSVAIQKAGGEFLGRVVQKDYYFAPLGKSLSDSDEVLRIREQGGLILLSYKGPHLGESVRSRPKFEFVIDGEIKNLLLSRYGSIVKCLYKTRSIFQLGSVTICSDELWKFSETESEHFGAFTELKTLMNPESNRFLRQVAAALGLSYDKIFTSAYSEI